MSSATTGQLPLILLDGCMREDYRAAVAQRALAFAPRASETALGNWRLALRRDVRVSGFRDSSHAPDRLLLPAVLEAFRFSERVIGATLELWVESQAELRGAWESLLVEREVAFHSPGRCDWEWNGGWASEARSALDEFQQRWPEYGWDDVALMLCCLTRCLPGSVESGTDVTNAGGTPQIAASNGNNNSQENARQAMQGTKWEQWLEELNGLAADAPEWDALEEFQQAIALLAVARRGERLSTRDQIAMNLAVLRQECADDLRYFNLGDCAGWSAEALPVAVAQEVIAALERLRADLKRHTSLRQHPPSNREEAHKQWQELTALELRILETHTALAASLFVAPAQTAVEPPVEVEESPLVPPVAPAAVEEEGENLASEYNDPVPERDDATDSLNLPSPEPEAQHEVEGSDVMGEALVEKPRQEEFDSLLWRFLLDDDAPGAYWLARSMVDDGRKPPVPDWLLAAMQGAYWLRDEADPLVDDLLEIARERQPEAEKSQELFGLAASLRAALIAPRGGLIPWVKDCLPQLHEVVTAVRDFAQMGKTLQAEDWLGAVGDDQREMRVKDAAAAVRRWLDEAPSWRSKMRGASDVWQHWVGPKGALRTLLTPAANDDRDSATRLQQQLGQWNDHNYIVQQMNELYYALRAGVPAKPITGAPRNQLARDAQEGCELARRWLEAVSRARGSQSGNGTLPARAKQLRYRLQQALPEAEGALLEMSRTSEPRPIAAAAHCLLRALAQLRQTLNLAAPANRAVTTESPNHIRDEADNLATALSRRLLWLPEIDLMDGGQPQADQVRRIAAALIEAFAEKRTLAHTIGGWLKKLDFRFVPGLLEALPEGAEKNALAERYESELAGARAALRGSIARARDEIEQAVVDGLITEERSEYGAAVESLDPDTLLNFAPARARLDQVSDDLREARRRRLAELRSRAGGIAADLDKKLTAEQREQVQLFLDAAFAKEDTRVIDECLARLTETFSGSGFFEENWLSPVVQRDVLNEFLRASRGIDGHLRQVGLSATLESIHQGRQAGEINFASLAPERRAEASETIRAWLALKRRGARGERNERSLGTILKYLGFTPGKEEFIARVKGRGSDWLHAKARMSASEFLVKPIPQFGSEAKGEYDVVCLWEHPGADTIGARLHDLRLSVRNLLVFYLGCLTERQRSDVASLSRKHDLAIAMLDEVLLLFLAGEGDDRLRPFLRCSLPYAAVNPYTPFKAGDVPPEMFAGRDAMARELQKPEGSCLVYGGRQLGKSALLRHVERRFHNPEGEQYAWVRDTRLVFDPQAGKDASHIWSQLREDFIQASLLPPSSARLPKTISQVIREVMAREPGRRVLVMFDEADEFLDADASNNFQTVIALRELMVLTNYRLKVVFAGLQNVQRFQGIPNQPLAHLGRPLLVGPLDPKEAHGLVREPFEALGYRFDDEATALLVLSYTNYHAGLIQLFCHELLKRLHARAGTSEPPYRIERGDVEAVYRNPQVRHDIRDRLYWTLALRPHYQAVAWAIIQDQMEPRDSYARTYVADKILTLCRDWWPQGFASFSTDDLRGLLDEMCGLGVLIRNEQGLYRLRSPNLVRLMGAEEDISQRLLELSYKSPEVSFTADSHHARLGEQHYSPLTYAQERALNPARYGVSLVFASEALGYSHLAEAIRRFIPEHLPEQIHAECAQIPAEVNSGMRMKQWLNEFQRRRQKHERLVVFQLMAGEPESLAERAQEALKFCQRHRQSQQQWMRVILLFDPKATWSWLTLPSESRRKLEEQADAVTFPRRWVAVGLSQRLTQQEKMSTEEVCDETLRVTGGWPWLLDHLFEWCQKLDPRPYAQEIEQKLVASDGKLACDFRKHLGAMENEIVWRVLQFLHSEGPLNRGLIIPEFIHGEPTLSAAQCEAAVEYLLRLGCLEIEDESLRLEPVVQRVCDQQ